MWDDKMRNDATVRMTRAVMTERSRWRSKQGRVPASPCRSQGRRVAAGSWNAPGAWNLVDKDVAVQLDEPDVRHDDVQFQDTLQPQDVCRTA